MLISRRMTLRPRATVIFLLLTPLCYFWFFHLKPAIHHHHHHRAAHPRNDLDNFPLPSANKSSPAGPLSVNLIVASTTRDDISWTSKLEQQIPNLQVIRYVSDSQSAEYYHPPQPKGREALMYLTYMHDFYDTLPDISIFVHAEESPWHMDGALLESIPFALARLDFDRVRDRGYFNLRTNWKHGCPAQINTTKIEEAEWDGEKKPEQHLMAAAFVEVFGVHVTEVPEILAGTCCSQFAVSREAITQRRLDEYKHYISWLLSTPLTDQLSGRVWERFWPYLFLRKPIECPIEWKVLCRMYRVCFGGEKALRKYQQVWDARRRADANVTFWGDVWRPREMERLRGRSGEYTEWLYGRLREASEVGEKEDGEVDQLGDLYVP